MCSLILKVIFKTFLTTFYIFTHDKWIKDWAFPYGSTYLSTSFLTYLSLKFAEWEPFFFGLKNTCTWCA